MKAIMENKLKALVDSIHATLAGGRQRRRAAVPPGRPASLTWPPRARADPSVRQSTPERTLREVETLQRLVNASVAAIRCAPSQGLAVSADDESVPRRSRSAAATPEPAQHAGRQ